MTCAIIAREDAEADKLIAEFFPVWTVIRPGQALSGHRF
jgi:hypothetical protein